MVVTSSTAPEGAVTHPESSYDESLDDDELRADLMNSFADVGERDHRRLDHFDGGTPSPRLYRLRMNNPTSILVLFSQSSPLRLDGSSLAYYGVLLIEHAAIF